MSDRLEKLRALEAMTLLSIEDSMPDKRSALIAQYRAILSEISELAGDADGKAVESNGLIDFQAALAQRRQSAASASRSS